MFAVHRLEDAVRAGLHRQMQIGHQLVAGTMRLDQRIIHVVRVAGGEADPLQPINGGQVPD